MNIFLYSIFTSCSFLFSYLQTALLYLSTNRTVFSSQPFSPYFPVWRRIVSHHNATSPSIRLCDPPKVVRFDIEKANFDVLNPCTVPNDCQSAPAAAYFCSQPCEHHSHTFLYGLLYLPRQPPPPGGFPTIHYVYGGPSIQLVRGAYSKSLWVTIFFHWGVFISKLN